MTETALSALLNRNHMDINANERQRWGGPSPWAGKDSRTDAQKQDDDPENIVAEIILLSSKLPRDHWLRIAVACAPRVTERR